MQLLAHLIHEQLEQKYPNFDGARDRLSILERHAARAIVERDEKLLLMYTERYDDFSFPGGGIDIGEDPMIALQRELREETGAQQIDVGAAFGKVTEFLPTWKPNYDVMYQTSYWYHCYVHGALGPQQLEGYEIQNGMRVEWLPLQEALQHNQHVLKARPPSMGISIHRETEVMQRLLNQRQHSANLG